MTARQAEIVESGMWQLRHAGRDGAELSPYMDYFGLFEDAWLREKNAPIMQSTGLHDKNGKEIYEGDIGFIRVMDVGKALCKLVWHDIGWAWEKLDPMQAVRANPGNYWSPIVKDFEVIGNIYENPELLDLNP